MGNSFVELLNIFREKPTPMPKNYKRTYDPPPKEEHTMYGKFKRGLKNFVYLGYLLAVATVSFIIYKIYTFTMKQYYRYKVSATPMSDWKTSKYYREQLKAYEDKPVQSRRGSPVRNRMYEP